MNLYLFFLTSLLLNLTPGNDMLFVASRSISQGSKAGVISAIGIFCGCFVHIAAAVLGLSLVIAQSAMLFNAIKYAGAGYLIFIGVKALLHKQVFNPGKNAHKNVKYATLFRQGVFTNVLNPKVAIFFLSFLPQFINPHSQGFKMELFALGLWFAVQGTLVLIVVALILGRAKNFFKQKPKVWMIQEKITGLILISLGIKVALAARK